MKKSKNLLFLIAIVLTLVTCKKAVKDKNKVSGAIYFEHGLTIYKAGGASVSLHTTDGTSNTTADSQGKYSFSNVKDGSVSITCSGNYPGYGGYYEGSGSTNVKGDDSKTVDIEMY